MATNINLTLEDLIAAISALAGQSEACCEVGGQVIDDPPSDGEVIYGPGQDYPDAESYFNAKCSSSNAIYDTVRGMIDWLRDNNVDLKLGALGSITTALVLGLALAGPVGWALQLSGVVITVLAGFIIKSIFDFIDMLDGLDDVHQELVVGLYNADSAETARANFLTVFEGASPSPSSLELTLTGFLLPGSVLNQLFVPRPDVGSYESPDPIDCGASILQVWSFTAGLDSWTHADIGEGNKPSTAAWDSLKQAIKTDFTVDDDPGGSVHEYTSPAISIAVTPGATCQLDRSTTSDGLETGIYLEVKYSDASIEWIIAPKTSSAGTVILTLTQSKSIVQVRCEAARLWEWTETPSTHFQHIFEVRIFGAG